LRNVRVCFGLILAVFLSSGFTAFAADLRCDIDGNGKVNLTDAVMILGWINSGRSSDKTAILTEAQLLYPVTTTVYRVPDPVGDDIDGNGKLNLSDVVYSLGWINAGRAFDSSAIETEAKLLYPVSSSLNSFPGLEIGSSTIPISITGITPN